MEIRQHLKLSQQLVMTPQLQQAIKLLQLSRMELVDLVRDEMLENPILEDEMDLDNERSRGARRRWAATSRQLQQLERRRRDRDARSRARSSTSVAQTEIKADVAGGQRDRLGELPRQLLVRPADAVVQRRQRGAAVARVDADQADRRCTTTWRGS